MGQQIYSEVKHRIDQNQGEGYALQCPSGEYENLDPTTKGEREIEKGNLRNFTHHQDATTINARVVCGQNLVILAPFLPAKTMK